MLKKLFSSFLFFLLCSKCIAQGKDFIFTHLSREDRLLSNGIHQTRRDHNGFTWFASNNGLQFYEGRWMKNFQHEPSDTLSLPGNSVQSLMEDSKNRLWVFTTSGAGVYDPVHFNFKPVPVEIKTPPNNIYPFSRNLEDSKGNIWVTLYPGGLFIYNSAANSLKPYTTVWPACFASIYHITQDAATGFYWLGTDSGLVVYNSVNKEYYHHRYNPYKLQCLTNDKLKGVATAFSLDRNNVLWMIHWASKEGPNFFSYDINTNTLTDLVSISGNVHGFITDASGTVWSYGEELSWYDKRKNKFITIPKRRYDRLGIDFDDINDLYEDKEGNLWCSTNMGVYQFNPRQQRFITAAIESFSREKIVDANVNNFIETKDGHIIALGWGVDGLYFYDTAFNRIKNLYGYDSKKISDFNFLMCWSGLQDSRGLIWVGCQSGRIMTIDPITNTQRNFSLPAFAEKTVRSITEDNEGNLWFGTQNNVIVKWIRASNSFIQVMPPPPGKYDMHIILRIVAGDNKDLWLATSGGGLVHMDLQGNVLEQFLSDSKTPTAIRSNNVNEIIKLSTGDFLLATGNGIELFTVSNRSFTALTEKRGLSTDNIISLRIDEEGNIWYSTFDGLSKINLASLRITKFGTKEGITAENFYPASSAKFRNGTIAFGNSRGFVHFNPADIKDPQSVPDVRITSFSLFGRMLPVDSLFKDGNTVHLNYTENFISIRFSAMSFLLNDNLNYYCMMEGLDKDWVKVGVNREATYTYLPGGSYTFKVRAVSQNGIESENITSFKIRITPPFWKRWWFYALLFLIASGIIYFIDRIRINRIKDMEKVRLRIARDLHDDMGSTLSTINILSTMAKTKMADDPVKTGEYIGKISDNSQRMMEAMDDIVWSIKPSNDSMQKITARMREFATGILEPKDIELEFKVEEKVNDIKMNMEARRDFFLIFKEAVNNVAKYSECSKCCIRIALHHGRLLLDVEDNGIGFDVTTADNGNGLSNMVKRAEPLKGRVQVQSQPGKGTRVTLNMPVG